MPGFCPDELNMREQHKKVFDSSRWKCSILRPPEGELLVFLMIDPSLVLISLEVPSLSLWSSRKTSSSSSALDGPCFSSPLSHRWEVTRMWESCCMSSDLVYKLHEISWDHVACKEDAAAQWKMTTGHQIKADEGQRGSIVTGLTFYWCYYAVLNQQTLLHRHYFRVLWETYNCKENGMLCNSVGHLRWYLPFGKKPQVWESNIPVTH